MRPVDGRVWNRSECAALRGAITTAFTTFSGIRAAAAYAYAVGGGIPNPFAAELMDEMFEKEPPPAPAGKPAQGA